MNLYQATSDLSQNKKFHWDLYVRVLFTLKVTTLANRGSTKQPVPNKRNILYKNWGFIFDFTDPSKHKNLHLLPTLYLGKGLTLLIDTNEDREVITESEENLVVNFLEKLVHEKHDEKEAKIYIHSIGYPFNIINFDAAKITVF